LRRVQGGLRPNRSHAAAGNNFHAAGFSQFRRSFHIHALQLAVPADIRKNNMLNADFRHPFSQLQIIHTAGNAPAFHSHFTVFGINASYRLTGKKFADFPCFRRVPGSQAA
jgi:hypothetical protein